ncbi:MAG: cytoplasmic protein [Pelagibacteraceae bacterium]|nr:cytoplasmic protein [Pelagibacteraceae bacterium]
MAKILMPKATAVWLLDNTSLTFTQISEFCELHILEVESMANGEVVGKMPGINPINNGILTIDEIKKCEKNQKTRLKINKSSLPKPKKIAKGAKYTPIAKRQERPSAIKWLLKEFPSISDNEICRLIRTTKNTVDSIRNKSHWNYENIIAKDPLKLGFCNIKDLDKISELHKKDEDTKNKFEENNNDDENNKIT